MTARRVPRADVFPAPRLRPLPVRVTPVPGELATSLQDRLARANHLRPHDLDELLAPAQRARRRRRPPDLSGLAALSGYPAAALARLLGDPRAPDCDRRWACRRCTARRRITAPVEICRACHAPACRRHRLWLVSPNWSSWYGGVPGAADLDLRALPQVWDLRVVPEVWSAQRRHTRLARSADRAGDGAAEQVLGAFKQARWVLWRWSVRGDWPAHRLRRLRHWIDPTRHGLDRGHPLLEIANYPETVALTGLLADPHRRWPQPGDGAAGLERVVAAVRRALDIAYEPYHAQDPLLQVIEQRGREQRWHDRGLL